MKAEIPTATVARLPRYLRCLSDLATMATSCSSDQLAVVAGGNAAQVRKDLSYIGSQGTRGVGYDIEELMGTIRTVLGMDRRHPVVIVGAGNFGAALTNYKGFGNWGFEIVAILDNDSQKVGRPIDGHTIESMERLEEIVADKAVEIGIIATPASAAQYAADRLTDAGVKSILNLAPVVLMTEDDVSLRRVDISTELGILAHHLSKS